MGQEVSRHARPSLPHVARERYRHAVELSSCALRDVVFVSSVPCVMQIPSSPGMTRRHSAR